MGFRGKLMKGFKRIGLILAIYAFIFLPVAQAEDENFGKNTPSEAAIIDVFKSNNAMPAASRTRGINIIDAGKSKPKSKHKPITPVMEEKAISLQVLFDYDSANLTTEAMRQLHPVGQALASDDLKGMSFRIEGHTDVIGGDQYNLDLSRRRADAVKQYLIDQYGLVDIPIQIVGKGKTDLADRDNPTSEVNRRVRIVRLGKAD